MNNFYVSLCKALDFKLSSQLRFQRNRSVVIADGNMLLSSEATFSLYMPPHTK